MAELNGKAQAHLQVPPNMSFTLQISKKDGERIVEASEALKGLIAASKSTASARRYSGATFSTEGDTIPEMVYEAARKCDHPLIVQFLERISCAALNEQEMQGATLLFDESNKVTKLRQLFAMLSTKSSASSNAEPQPQLDLAAATSLFRIVLVAVSSCLQTSDQSNASSSSNKDFIVEGKPSSNLHERPNKRAKLLHSSDATASTKDLTEDGSTTAPFQSPSWDSSLATLRDDDDHSLVGIRKDLEDLAVYAANELIKYASARSARADQKKESDVVVDFALFGTWYNEAGKSLVPWIELLQLSKWRPPKEHKKGNGSSKSDSRDSSPGSLLTEAEDRSRTLVSFDFTGSGSPTPLLINISEDNLRALQALVQRTNLMQRTAADICKTLIHSACPRQVNGKDFMVLRREDFRRTIRLIIPEYVFAQLSKDEQSAFSDSLFDFFSCFEQGRSALHEDEVDAKEFAVGFCFFCAGNKSTKLAVGYELLDSKRRGYLTEDQLLRYLQAYLTMLVGMSLLTPLNRQNRRRPLTKERRKAMRTAIESGAKWTLAHFLKASGQTKNEYTFECFASWYSSGGYNVAPWLELLDMTKVLSLIAEPSSPIDLPPLETTNSYQTTERPPRARDRVSSLRRHHLARRSPPEILFTFPLGNRRSLVVLKEDAIYVRAVVEQLGLLTMKPDDLWSQLSTAVEKSRKPSNRPEPAVYVNMETFVRIMKSICPKTRKRQAPGDPVHATSSSAEELLRNFFQCFDIDQVDSVALDELMGGLTLLCGGKKSHKLAFAFSIFDTRPGVGKKKGITHSLSGEDLFLFLRSVLIVTFSTCRQSLDLTDDMVGRCIADTANMICNDVMRHQWETKRMDRLDFDEFGQWYNDGGFERAPWLELLDLKKWVLVDDLTLMDKQRGPPPPLPPPPPPPAMQPLPGMPPHPIASVASREMASLADPNIPPPPPDGSLDHSFFDTDAIMNIDSMDEMDMILMQNSHDREDFPKITKSFSYGAHSPRQHPPSQSHRRGNPLKFHLNTTEDHGGYQLSVSQARIRHFRRILEASGLHEVDSETACNKILSSGRSKLTRKEFDAALRSILPTSNHDRKTDRSISDIFSSIFAAFDSKGTGQVNALEVACGFTVLCRGKKSDKLEFAFEVLDKNKRGRLSQTDMASYLQSFLSVLLSIAFSPTLENDPADDSLTTITGTRCDRNTPTLIRAVKAGADWAASLAFRDFDRSKQAPTMSFDDFADWYTSVGYSSIPWLELLDLQKWAMLNEN